MDNEFNSSYFIGKLVVKQTTIRNLMKDKKKEGKFEEYKELKAKQIKEFTRAIYLLRSKIVGDKFENSKTHYRFNDDHFKEICNALKNLCYSSYGKENKCINAFIESIKNAEIIVNDE
jgi:hypothetical protein